MSWNVERELEYWKFEAECRKSLLFGLQAEMEERERESFDRISSCGVWGVLDLEEMQKMEKGRLKLSFGGVWAG